MQKYFITLSRDVPRKFADSICGTVLPSQKFFLCKIIAANLTGSSAVENNAVITIGEGCTWTLTGDCTITSLTNNGTIDFNGYTITLADGSILK